MSLPSTTISLNDIANFLGAPTPISLGGSRARNLIPINSGAISLGDFRNFKYPAFSGTTSARASTNGTLCTITISFGSDGTISSTSNGPLSDIAGSWMNNGTVEQTDYLIEFSVLSGNQLVILDQHLLNTFLPLNDTYRLYSLNLSATLNSTESLELFVTIKKSSNNYQITISFNFELESIGGLIDPPKDELPPGDINNQIPSKGGGSLPTFGGFDRR